MAAPYKEKKKKSAPDDGYVDITSQSADDGYTDITHQAPALNAWPGASDGPTTVAKPSLWQRANTGIVSPDAIARTAMTGVSRDGAGMGMDELQSMRDEMNIGDNSAIMPTTLPTDINERKRVLAAAAPKFKARERQGETPFQAARRRGGAGTVMSAADTLSSFTSPVSATMAGMGALGKVAPAASTLSKVANVGSKAAGIGFGAHGAQQAFEAAPKIDPTYQGITENPETLGFTANPDAVGQFFGGASMAAGGAADVGEIGKVGMRRLNKSMANRPVEQTGGLTTGDVYNELKNRGVDMTIGQAGQGKIGRFVDEVVSRTPGGAGRMAKFKMKQGEQYAGAVKGIEDQFDPTGANTDISEKGGQLQRALSMAKDVSHDNASQAFRDTLGDMQYTTADTADIANAAKEAKARLMSGQLDSMRPNSGIDVLDEIINKYGDQHNNKSMVDDLFRDRSRLMKSEFTDSLAPGEAEGVMRQMAGVMRKSLEVAATKSGKLDQFNKAMTGWQDYIDTFGNKRSPVNQAISQLDPTKVLEPFINSRGTGSLNAIRMLKRVAPDFVGMLKREVVRKLYDPNATGVRENYGNMQANLLRYNLPFLKELFTPQELRTLRAVAAGGRSIGLDVNPSGSGKYEGQLATTLGVGGSAATGLIGMAQHNPLMGGLGAAGAVGIPAAANIGARVQTSPAITDFLMGRQAPSVAPAASGAALSTRPAGGRAVSNPFGKAKQGIARFHNDQTGTVTFGADGEPVWPENYRNVDKTKPGGANYSEADLEALKKKHGIKDKSITDRIGDFNKDESGSMNVSALHSLISKMMGEGASDKEVLKAQKSMEKTDTILSDDKKLTALSKSIAKAHNENGGSTVHPVQGDMMGKDAFATSVFPELTQTIEGDKVTPQQVKEFLSDPKRQEVLRSDPRISVGTWASDGKVMLDLVATPNDLNAARELGGKYNQISIYDLKHGREIKTGGTGEGASDVPMTERLKHISDPGTIDAVHYSNEGELSELDPSKFGSTGNTSETRIQQAFPDHYQPVSFLGERESYRAANERQITSKPNRYGSELNKSRYYDIHADPQGLIDKASQAAAADGNYGNEALNAYLQKAIREAGYSGTINGRSGVITSWDKVPVSKEIIPEWADSLLTKQERDSLKTEHTTRKFVTTINSIPEVKDWVEAAKAGEIGRKWYERGNKAFDALTREAPDYFKEGDREKFANLVAATSPQQAVTQNMRESLDMWKKWVDAGRPTDSATLQKLLDRNLTMAGSKVNNAILALTGKEMWPTLDKAKYYKVPSFAKNLNDMLSHVTNDSWMGIFSGIMEPAMPRPEHYHAVSVLTREAARQLGWKPAEAQAAIWVFTRTLTEMSRGKNFDPQKTLAGMTNEHMKAYADDFADIMANDAETRSLLKRLGVNLESLDQKLEAIGHPAVTHGIESASQDSLGRTAGRIGIANDVAKQTATKPVAEEAPVQDEGGDTSFDTEALDEAPKTNHRDGVEKASPLHKAELAAWKGGLSTKGADVYPEPGTPEYRAREAATIANTVASKRDHVNTETYVSRRGNRSLGVVQLDTYGHEKGYPLSIDWLATHPDVITGKTQEKGIGTELFTHAVKRAAELGVGLQLESAEGARSFYEKMGMKPMQKNGKQYQLTKQQVRQLADK